MALDHHLVRGLAPPSLSRDECLFLSLDHLEVGILVLLSSIHWCRYTCSITSKVVYPGDTEPRKSTTCRRQSRMCGFGEGHS